MLDKPKITFNNTKEYCFVCIEYTIHNILLRIQTGQHRMFFLELRKTPIMETMAQIQLIELITYTIIRKKVIYYGEYTY